MSAPANRWLDSDPGHPLGRGYPGGSPLREDGETHRTAWMRLLRADPCAYCDSPGPAETVDHIEPRSRPARAPDGAHCWTNYTGACARCNAGKAAKPLLAYLAQLQGLIVSPTPPRRTRPRSELRLLRPAQRQVATR